jgi:hypothetical protein
VINILLIFYKTGLDFFGEDDDVFVHSNVTDRPSNIFPDVGAQTFPYYQVSS